MEAPAAVWPSVDYTFRFLCADQFLKNRSLSGKENRSAHAAFDPKNEHHQEPFYYKARRGAETARAEGTIESLSRLRGVHK
jgi:hypothetical protein